MSVPSILHQNHSVFCTNIKIYLDSIIKYRVENIIQELRIHILYFLCNDHIMFAHTVRNIIIILIWGENNYYCIVIACRIVGISQLLLHIFNPQQGPHSANDFVVFIIAICGPKIFLWLRPSNKILKAMQLEVWVSSYLHYKYSTNLISE